MTGKNGKSSAVRIGIISDIYCETSFNGDSAQVILGLLSSKHLTVMIAMTSDHYLKTFIRLVI